MTPHKPNVTVILPVFNTEKLVGEAISSVLDQDFKDFEFLIINDGSTDGTEAAVKKFKDARIRYIKQKNKGEYATMNRAFSLSRGEYITLIHADDLLAPRALSAKVKCLNENPKVEIAHGAMVKTDLRGKVITRYEASDESDGKKILEGYCIKDLWAGQKNPIQYVTIMLRKTALNKIGKMDETIRYGGDLDWLMRAMRMCTFKKVPGAQYYYRRHSGAISRVVEREGLSTKEATVKIQRRHCPRLR